MIVIDTNVLLRYILEDDVRQSPRAREIILANAPALVTDVSLAEAIWTLSGSRYGLKKPEISRTLRSLIEDACLTFESRQVIWDSLRDYENARPVRGKEVDFADALIVNRAKRHGANRSDPVTDIYSFDVALGQLDSVRIL